LFELPKIKKKYAAFLEDEARRSHGMFLLENRHPAFAGAPAVDSSGIDDRSDVPKLEQGTT
jgi:hypothetical protein